MRGRRQPLELESIDLAELARQIAARVPADARKGEIVGRTVFRDATMVAMGCSALQAEHLVDTLVVQRFLVFASEPPPGHWEIRLDAA